MLRRFTYYFALCFQVRNISKLNLWLTALKGTISITKLCNQSIAASRDNVISIALMSSFLTRSSLKNAWILIIIFVHCYSSNNFDLNNSLLQAPFLDMLTRIAIWEFWRFYIRKIWIVQSRYIAVPKSTNFYIYCILFKVLTF